MATSAVQRFYRYHAYVYDSTRWMILHGRRQAVERMNLQPGSQVLEIGCGTGLNFKYMVDRLEPAAGGRLTGVDFSADMLRRAEARVDRQGWTHVALLQADAEKLALGQKFDAILFAYSLTMIPDWPAALRRAADHLTPAGRVVVLDFGQFAGWGPMGPVMRTWLKLNHVATRKPYIEEMRRVFNEVTVHDWLGGYNFTAIGRRNVDADCR